MFEQSQKLPLWRDLQLNLWLATENYAAIIQAVTPAQKLAIHDTLAFSEQVLYGEALMGQKNWSAARDFWLQLLKLSQTTNSSSMYRLSSPQRWFIAATWRRFLPQKAQ